MVLSACSSYFQSLFLDHPSRHPIVILKDVRFTELRTLVEFMYKGEVNVQYCQLSALLKTAESLKVVNDEMQLYNNLFNKKILINLKVKGLAEMTNQSTTFREPEHEPDRLRPPPPTTHPASRPESLDATQRLEPDKKSPSPTRLQLSPTPLALYHRKSNREYTDPPDITTNNQSTYNIKNEHSREPTTEDDAMSNDMGIILLLFYYFQFYFT